MTRLSAETCTTCASTCIAGSAPASLQPDLAAVGGPLHAPDEGANPLCHGVDGRDQTVARFVARVSVLHESVRRGMASLPPGACG